MVSQEKKKIMTSVINVFETDTIERDYSSIYVYRDGPGGIRQITLGFGITEYGNMAKLIEKYIVKNGIFSNSFSKYVNSIGRTPLVDNQEFRRLLSNASKQDELFKQAEDEIFDEKYWIPANNWAQKNGFKKDLSIMVILDSFIHSGSILGFLRNRFSENTPINGGSEQVWITSYTTVRRKWLANHSNEILRNTVYRMDFFGAQIYNQNWDLDCPLTAHGRKVC